MRSVENEECGKGGGFNDNNNDYKHSISFKKRCIITGPSVNPTLINRTSLRASKRLLQQSTTMIGVNRVY